MPDKHALLSASSAHRWLMCPRSAKLSESVPNKSSSFAEEGTQAHAVCEYKLRKLLGEEPEEEPVVLDDEMAECTDAYRDFVEEELNAALAVTKDSRLFIEQQLDFSDYVPDGFGTSDAVIVSDDTLEIIDFKYGRGVQVEAPENPQLRLYAVGALIALGPLYEFEKIKTVVFQPRLHHISMEEIGVVELLDWASNVVKPAAKLAYKGKGKFAVGEWCRWCGVEATCKARVEEAFSVIKASDTNPDLIADSEIPSILDKLDNAEKWIAAIRKYAEERAISEGTNWEGYKLVESTTRRTISNEIEALDRLTRNGFEQDDLTTLKMKGITDLEKVVGKAKFKELVGDLIVKPAGHPTLVKESDKRPAINPIQEAFKE